MRVNLPRFVPPWHLHLEPVSKAALRLLWLRLGLRRLEPVPKAEIRLLFWLNYLLLFFVVGFAVVFLLGLVGVLLDRVLFLLAALGTNLRPQVLRFRHVLLF